jgi:hypothetical protein
VKKRCAACEFGCNVCDAGRCEVCASGLELRNGKCVVGVGCGGVMMGDGRCVKQCEDGTYNDGKFCQACPENCQTCTNPNNCTSCLYEMMIQDGKCQPDCKDDFEYDNKRGLCVKGTLTNCLRYAWRTNRC